MARGLWDCDVFAPNTLTPQKSEELIFNVTTLARNYFLRRSWDVSSLLVDVHQKANSHCLSGPISCDIAIVSLQHSHPLFARLRDITATSPTFAKPLLGGTE